MPNKQLLLRYAELKIQEKQIAADIELIKEQVTSEIEAINTDKPIVLQELPGYSFSLQKRKTWTYSGIVAELEKRFKDRKKLEEQTGEASFVEKPGVIFNTPKE